MSEQPWEKYVKPASEAMEQFWAPLRGYTDHPDEIDLGLARAVLAAVYEDIRRDVAEEIAQVIEAMGSSDSEAAGRKVRFIDHQPDWDGGS